MSDLIVRFTKHLIARLTWGRLVTMLVLATFYGIAETLLLLTVAFQMASVFSSGSPNPHVRFLGAQLSRYIYQLFLYLTYNSEQRPFPFSPWPREPVPSFQKQKEA